MTRANLAYRILAARLWPLLRWLRGDAAIDPRRHQPPLPLQAGTTRERLLECMASISVDGSSRGELENYARIDCDRFLYTLGLVPEDKPLHALEIGAGPYFTTMLCRWFRPRVTWDYTNYFGGDVELRHQSVSIDRPDGGTDTLDVPYWNANVESHRLPYDDASFDLVLFCEVLEHLTHDPLACMLELKRVLRPGGTLILTTPNVARLENVARLIVGQNLYDPYSGYGPYGRHNREYSQHELHQLLAHAGFAPAKMFTADVHANPATALVSGRTLKSLVGWRADSLGQYLFSVSTNAGPADARKPTWLYRSYPAAALVERSL